MEKLNSYLPNATSCFYYNVVLNALAIAKNIVEMEEVHKKMITAGVRPNSATYSMLVKGVNPWCITCAGYAYIGEWDKLNSIYTVMKDQGCGIGSKTFSYLVSQGSDIRYIHFAMDIYVRLLLVVLTADQRENMKSSLFPGAINLYIFPGITYLFSSCLKHDQLDYAEELWLTMFAAKAYPLPKTCDLYVNKLTSVLEQYKNNSDGTVL